MQVCDLCFQSQKSVPFILHVHTESSSNPMHTRALSVSYGMIEERDGMQVPTLQSVESMTTTVLLHV